MGGTHVNNIMLMMHSKYVVTLKGTGKDRNLNTITYEDLEACNEFLKQKR